MVEYIVYTLIRHITNIAAIDIITSHYWRHHCWRHNTLPSLLIVTMMASAIGDIDIGEDIYGEYNRWRRARERYY